MVQLIFKFSGGPLDGKTVVGQPGHQDEAHRYYALSYHGRVGQRFRTASDYTVRTLAREPADQQNASRRFQQHSYRVVDRIRNGDVLLVRSEYCR